MKGISKYKKRIRYSAEFNTLHRLLQSNNIHTICHSAACPNMAECFSKKKITFLILGDTCTRHCGFCNVSAGIPGRPDPDEPGRIAELVKELKLRYVIITSVTRDDLADGGCSVFIDVIEKLKQRDPMLKIEVLIPDLGGNFEALKQIALSGANVIGHNIETVKRLFTGIRPQADFNRSLKILKYLRDTSGPEILIKSGFMTGLGENMKEIEQLLYLLHTQGTDIVTVGQYFQPSGKNIPVQKAYTDNDFEKIMELGRNIGIPYVRAGRFVRSSYYAEEVFKRSKG